VRVGQCTAVVGDRFPVRLGLSCDAGRGGRVGDDRVLVACKVGVVDEPGRFDLQSFQNAQHAGVQPTGREP
jgi:hypothetical protein